MSDHPSYYASESSSYPENMDFETNQDLEDIHTSQWWWHRPFFPPFFIFPPFFPFFPFFPIPRRRRRRRR